MTAEEYLKQRSKMCKMYQNCNGCPIRSTCCRPMEMSEDRIKLELAVIEKWARENSESKVTRKDKFFEICPNAPVKEGGIPYFCCRVIGFKKYNCEDDEDCIKCWNELIDEE